MILTFQTLTIFHSYVNILYYLKILPYKMNEQFRIEVQPTREWYILTIASILVQSGFELLMLKSVFDINKYGIEHFVFCFAFYSLMSICSLAQVFILFRNERLASMINTFIKLNESFGKSNINRSIISLVKRLRYLFLIFYVNMRVIS